MVEQFANNANTTLNGGITSIATSLSVLSATSFPTVPQFRILVDTEVMLVTGVAGTTFTVSRGQEGTTAITHLSGATVSQILTNGALQQLKQDVWNKTWITTKTSNYTVQSSDQSIPVDTTSGPVTITLPSAPTDGEKHLIADVSGTANTNNISVSGNGHTIAGFPTYIITGQYNNLEVTYHAGKAIWLIT